MLLGLWWKVASYLHEVKFHFSEVDTVLETTIETKNPLGMLAS